MTAPNGPPSAGVPPDNNAKTDRKLSHGKIMRNLLDDHFTLIRSTDGRMFGVRTAEPGRAIQHDPKSSPLIRTVSRMFLDTVGKWPSTTGVSECSAYALAMFDDAVPRTVPLRSWWDRSESVFYIDTCDEDDNVLRVDATGVRAVDPPVTFRRAAVPAPMPWGQPGTAADIAPLWELVPITVEDRPLVLALMITAWMTETSQPIVTFTGVEDGGKTSTARYLLSFVDPVTISRGRSLPADEREWKAAVAYSRAVLVDNLSSLDANASDLLCRVATGGEAASRALYTDDEAHVSNLYVPVWLTTIDPGALRGDLASRMVKVELVALHEGTRLAESELAARQEKIRPQVTRGLLWLVVEVLKAWPDIDKSRLGHRMGDFAIAVRCIDSILKTEGEKRLTADSQDLAVDVVDASPLALAVVKLFERDPSTGAVLCPPGKITAAELLEVLDKARANADPWRTVPQSNDRAWPRTPKILSAALTRIEPALRKSHGIVVERGRTGSSRWMQLHKTEKNPL